MKHLSAISLIGFFILYILDVPLALKESPYIRGDYSSYYDYSIFRFNYAEIIFASLLLANLLKQTTLSRSFAVFLLYQIVIDSIGDKFLSVEHSTTYNAHIIISLALGAVLAIIFYRYEKRKSAP